MSASIAGQSAAQQLGTIELATFQNPAGLTAAGRQPLRSHDGVGRADDGVPGTDGMGTIAQGFLEDSNVSVVEEMVNMILGQRAYEANSQGREGRRRDAAAGQQPGRGRCLRRRSRASRSWRRSSRPGAAGRPAAAHA